MAGKDGKDSKGRLAESLARSFGTGDSGYEVSEAFAGPERRKLYGEWLVVSHIVDGEDWLAGFSRAAVRGHELRGAAAESRYRFHERVCVKRSRVEALVDLPGGPVTYSFSLGLALGWELAPGGRIRARAELGYVTTSLGGEPAATKELKEEGGEMSIHYRFEDGDLVLEEGGDVKRLRRLA